MSRSTDISALYREFTDALTDLAPRLGAGHRRRRDVVNAGVAYWR
jgi:hypothetical protein